MPNSASPQTEPQADRATADKVEQPEAPPSEHPTGPDALHEAIRRLAEAREYLVYLLAVEFDRLKLKFRRLLVLAVVGIAALVVVLAVLVSATFLMLWGLADLISAAFRGRIWIGALIVGGGILLLVAGGLYGGVWAWNRSAFRAAMKRYEQRKQRQRERFGHSVEQPDDPMP